MFIVAEILSLSRNVIADDKNINAKVVGYASHSRLVIDLVTVDASSRHLTRC